MPDDRRLIEDYLPIEEISKEASREKSVRKGHISTLHLWWARRPLVACRAAVYGALVPADRWVPEVELKNPPADAAKAAAMKNGAKRGLNRKLAGKFVTRLCRYPKDSDGAQKMDIEKAIDEARGHIREAHAERLTAELVDALKLPLPPGEGWGEGAPSWLNEFKWPRDKTTVTADDIAEGRAPKPRVLDMFAGGGAIPLEALRLGCEAYALDLNPVAHIIELCTLVYPQKYGKPDPTARGMTGPPLVTTKDTKNAKHDEARERDQSEELRDLRGLNDPSATSPVRRSWGGLAEEVRYWGNWVLEKVRAEIGDLYPPIPDPEAEPEEIGGDPQQKMAFAKDRQGCLTVPRGYLTPVAYLWTRTVKCKNPSGGATVPLVRQTWLCKKEKRFVALKMIAPKGGKAVRFEVVEAASEKGLGFDPEGVSKGGNATCLFCGTVADTEYVKSQGEAGLFDVQLMAVACAKPGTAGKRFMTLLDRSHVSPTEAKIRSRIEAVCRETGLTEPAEPLPVHGTLGFRPQPYGFRAWRDMFLPRQLLALLCFVRAIRQTVLDKDERSVAIRSYLACAFDKIADCNNAFCAWEPVAQCARHLFGRHAIPMVWDFGESVPIAGSAGDWNEHLERALDSIGLTIDSGFPARVHRGSATALPWDEESFDAVITDPYYDNVPYADISDFFYVWLKRLIGDSYPEHFGTEKTPKKSEAIAEPARHGGNPVLARKAYETMMAESFREAHRVLKPAGQLTVVYAHKTTLGWSTLVDALRSSGFTVTEAWPLDTENASRLRAMESAALASSIFLIARKRGEVATIGNYEDDVRPELEQIVRERVETLWEMGIAGADLLIAAVGAGLRAFTKYARVEFANGEEVPAERFLAEVEGVVLDTILRRLSKEVGGNGGKMTLAGVDEATSFYVLWRYAYKAATLDAGEAIIFANGTHIELDGAKGLSTGPHAIVEKLKGKYHLKDFTERGKDEHIGQRSEDGKPAPLIDALHRVLWLVENRPRALTAFLEEASPDRERLRLVAQALAGTALKGSGSGMLGAEAAAAKAAAVGTTPAESAALNKLTTNWRSLIEQPLAAGEAAEGLGLRPG